jgi:H/ACA ribonucleoprotein complex subunit 4
MAPESSQQIPEGGDGIHVVYPDAPTDPAHGRRPEERSLREHLLLGVLLLDKPSGPSSRRSALAAARLLGIRKVGHGGTLDPKVTGVLPVLLAHSTPVAEILLGCDKTYEGTMALHGDASDSELADAMASFVGVIEQLPPRRSAVKRAVRKRTVYRFGMAGREGANVAFVCACEGGTYVRKLVHDLGERLGCGAHMTGLRRTQSGPFAIDECVTMEALCKVGELPGPERDAALRRIVLSLEDVVARILPRLWVADGAVRSICTGYPLMAPGVCRLASFARGDSVAVLTLKGELVALGSAMMSSADIIRERSGVCVTPDRVFMAKETYPKWSPGKE